MKRIVIFASGSGTNAENLIKFFHNRDNASVIQVLTNNPHAKVLERAKNLNVSALSFNRVAFSKTDDVLNILKAAQPDLIILAGFLWKFPEHILQHFPNKVINIHPALLPKYGGKGMYGMHVHEAVVANNETETGITIHYVNENYDEGAIIFQAKCSVESSDTAEAVAAKIHELEMEHFPKVVEGILKLQVSQPNITIKTRLFSNREIQKKIYDVLKEKSETELQKYCDKDYSKQILNLDFALLLKAPKHLSRIEKSDFVKRNDVNRWTWKYAIPKENATYLICTQWYERHDEYVKEWLNK